MQSSLLVTDSGGDLSSTEFNDADWVSVEMPTTVLNALVNNGVYPDPRTALNNYLIPDASDDFNEAHDLGQFSHIPGVSNPWKHPWWFRTEFVAPDNIMDKQWLVIKAANYRIEVWINGNKIASPEDTVCPFIRKRFDITKHFKSNNCNCIAIKVFAPDHLGIPMSQLEVFQPHRSWFAEKDNMMHDVTINIAAVGYDCAQEVRDRLMGFWDDVYIEYTGLVEIRDPFIKTKLNLPDVSKAELTLIADVVNHSDEPIETVLHATVDKCINFEASVHLLPNEAKTVEFKGNNLPELVMRNPKLWMPFGYGEQNLYAMTITARINGRISDVKSVDFGIREVTKVLYELNGEYGLHLHINGQRIYCRGGYMMLDTLLDKNRLTTEFFECELRYLRECGLNLIAYEDMANLPENLLHLCDIYGILIWNCYFQCHWLIRDDYPIDHELLKQSAIDITKQARNHPCIVAYMCMNEGLTLESQYSKWKTAVEQYDGTRIHIPSGYFYADNLHYCPEWAKEEFPVGANDGVPKSYTWQRPSWYFKMVKSEFSWMFKMESGSASLPPKESLSCFIPNIDDHDGKAPYPLNAVWAHHGANDYYQDYDSAIRRRLGEPVSVDDYCWKGHLITAEQHRAMFEAVLHKKWDITSGFMQWKLNSCYPDVQWQIFDYYLRPMVSLYYIKKSCADAVILLTADDYTVHVANNSLNQMKNLTAEVRVYDFEMNLEYCETSQLDLKADSVQELFALPQVFVKDSVYFVKCSLMQDEQIIADNFYWISPRSECEDDENCYADLNKLPVANLQCEWSIKPSGNEYEITAQIANKGSKPALLVHKKLLDERGDEINPIYWDDDYSCLLPGECKAYVGRVYARHLKGNKPQLVLDCWRGCNVQ